MAQEFEEMEMLEKFNALVQEAHKNAIQDDKTLEDTAVTEEEMSTISDLTSDIEEEFEELEESKEFNILVKQAYQDALHEDKLIKDEFNKYKSPKTNEIFLTAVGIGHFVGPIEFKCSV